MESGIPGIDVKVETDTKVTYFFDLNAKPAWDEGAPTSTIMLPEEN